MKSIAISLAAIAGILCASTVPAATIYEPFNYQNGNLAGNTNLTAPDSLNGFNDTDTWTATGTGNVAVVSGDLSYSGLPTTPTTHMAQISNVNANPVRLGIGEYDDGSTIYFSMLMQVPTGATFPSTPAAATTTGSFLSGFQFNPASGTGNDMSGTSATAGGVLNIRTDPALDGYNLGIAFRDAPGTNRVYSSTKFLPGQTVYLVGKFDVGPGNHDDVASLYLNPDPTGAEPALANAVSAGAATTTFDYLYNATTGAPLTVADADRYRSFFLRANSLEPSNLNIDEVRIGASWEEVTGQIFSTRTGDVEHACRRGCGFARGSATHQLKSTESTPHRRSPATGAGLFSCGSASAAGTPRLPTGLFMWEELAIFLARLAGGRLP